MAAAETITPASILNRAQFPDLSKLSQEEARYLLGIGFHAEDKARIHSLLARNREGAATLLEKEELANLLSVSYFFDILHAKARLALHGAGNTGTAA